MGTVKCYELTMTKEKRDTQILFAPVFCNKEISAFHWEMGKQDKGVELKLEMGNIWVSVHKEQTGISVGRNFLFGKTWRNHESDREQMSFFQKKGKKSTGNYQSDISIWGDPWSRLGDRPITWNTVDLICCDWGRALESQSSTFWLADELSVSLFIWNIYIQPTLDCS